MTRDLSHNRFPGVLAARGKLPRWIEGHLLIHKRLIPRISTRLNLKDILDGLRVRCDSGRSRYRVDPGLFAAGNPSDTAPVLVTANYKLSFDALRKEIAGIDAWILVLDTRGINVWCAAGKGTFGTAELTAKLQQTRLASLVSHRTLILPQLGATGISAHEVQKQSGFAVVFGPVRARDLPRFLASGMRKDREMSIVTFTLSERLSVAPVELVHSWPFMLAALSVAAVAHFLNPDSEGLFGATLFALLSPLPVGTLLFPALLPVLPFKSFALKGMVLGLLWNACVARYLLLSPGWTASLVLGMTPLIAFLALNFTGSSTYTNLAGTRREVKIGIPLMLATETVAVITASVLVFGA